MVLKFRPVGFSSHGIAPKWLYGDSVEFIIFVFKILFTPNYHVKYYGYIVKWCSTGVV